jgi:hypothetical protein
MHERMPRSRPWASTGGIAPKEQVNDQGLITDNLLWESRNQREQPKPKIRQPILSWPIKTPDESEERKKEHDKDTKMSEREHDKDKEKDERRQGDQSNWVKGGGEEDNERYRSFLKYCDDRRQESKLQQEMDIERKQTAEKSERQLDLIRLSTEYLKQNEPKWRTMKIEECERIKEEEKKDRLAIVSQKKKRYGLKRLNKEENIRLKKRTEESCHKQRQTIGSGTEERDKQRAKTMEQREREKSGTD